jgi:hypothetical protein
VPVDAIRLQHAGVLEAPPAEQSGEPIAKAVVAPHAQLRATDAPAPLFSLAPASASGVQPRTTESPVDVPVDVSVDPFVAQDALPAAPPGRASRTAIDRGVVAQDAQALATGATTPPADALPQGVGIAPAAVPAARTASSRAQQLPASPVRSLTTGSPVNARVSALGLQRTAVLTATPSRQLQVQIGQGDVTHDAPSFGAEVMAAPAEPPLDQLARHPAASLSGRPQTPEPSLVPLAHTPTAGVQLHTTRPVLAAVAEPGKAARDKDPMVPEERAEGSEPVQHLRQVRAEQQQSDAEEQLAGDVVQTLSLAQSNACESLPLYVMKSV